MSSHQFKQLKTKIDLNILLRIFIVTIVISSIFSLYSNGSNKYINLNSYFFEFIYALELYIFLLIEKKRRDPFIIILCFQNIFYFLFRILTLSIFPFSIAFERFNFSPSDLNYTIIYIILCNLALFFGFYLNKTNLIVLSTISNAKPRNAYKILFVFVFGLLMSFPGTFGLSNIEWIIGLIASLFMDVYIIMLMILAYLILFKVKLSNSVKFIFISCLIFYAVLSTLAGSRSAVLNIIYFLMFVNLAVYGKILLKKSFIFTIALITPVLILIFVLTTFLRPRLEKRSNINTETISVLKEFSFQETFNSSSEIILSPVFDRIGYLDYAAELIAHEKEYKTIFTIPYYLKSVVDNILTPGFDIFDIPKLSNSQKFLYNKEGSPMKSKVDEAYQSDEFTLYGEFYMLFGKWFSLILMFFLAFCFKRIYIKLVGRTIFETVVIRSIILMIFFYFIQSFGMDWIASISLGFIITFLLFKRFFNFTIQNT